MSISLAMLTIILLVISSIRIKEEKSTIFSRSTSNTINGFFVILVFISHFKTYTNFTNRLDIMTVNVTYLIGQLMVITFLFFSGYGIMSSIMSDKNRSISANKMKHRFLSTWSRFAIAVTIYIVVGSILGDEFSIKEIIFGYLAWDSVGNSTWYMFAIFLMYIYLMISLHLTKDNKKLCLSMMVLALISFFILRNIKESYWYNTMFCFSLGMLIKYEEEKILNLKLSRISKIILMTVLVFLSLCIRLFRGESSIWFIAYTTLILLVMTLISETLEFKSSILSFFSKYTFEIYIYQRLFFRLFEGRIPNNLMYFIVSLLVTVVFSILIEMIYSKSKKYLVKFN